ncbi:MAG: CapA family protein [Patescibacteria group bacterium]
MKNDLINNPSILIAGDSFLDFYEKKEDPFKFIRQYFSKSDILFFNLESPVTNEQTRADKSFPIKVSPENVKYLGNLSKNLVVAIANNHLLDCGEKGFNDTTRLLDESNIDYIGSKEKKWITLLYHNIKIAFLSYTEFGGKDYLSIIEPERICDDISNIKKVSDFLIVSLHWGVENSHYPHPNQQKMAKNLIEAGADVVFGHHPHLIQGFEPYKNGLIFYSLGNFQFGTKFDISSSAYSYMVRLIINQNNPLNYEIIPIKITAYTYPSLLKNEQAEKMKSFIREISDDLTTLNPVKFYRLAAGNFLNNSFKSWSTRLKQNWRKTIIPCLKTIVSPYYLKMYGGFIIGLLIRKKPDLIKKLE